MNHVAELFLQVYGSKTYLVLNAETGGQDFLAASVFFTEIRKEKLETHNSEWWQGFIVSFYR